MVDGPVIEVVEESDRTAGGQELRVGRSRGRVLLVLVTAVIVAVIASRAGRTGTPSASGPEEEGASGARGGAVVDGEDWAASIACDNPTPTCLVEVVESDGLSWRAAIPIGWSFEQTLGRRGVLARSGAVEGALLLDVDDREIRPLDLPAPEGATFAVSGRYLVYPATGSQEAGRCALDLEREEFECSVQGFPFSGVLEPPG